MTQLQWEEQHEDLTCEQFRQWKIDNDPENQTAGLARYLEDNGIGNFHFILHSSPLKMNIVYIL